MGKERKKKLKSYFIDEKIPQEERDRQLLSFQEQNQSLPDLKQRVIRASESFARYRRTALTDRATENQNRTVGKRESAMAGINAEAEQREQLIAETEQRITGLHDHIYTSCIIDGNQFLVNGSNKIYCRYAL